MSLISRMKEYRENRRKKQEERTINNVANAGERIKELQAREKTLKERAIVLEEKRGLETAVKQRERTVKDLEYRQNNPVLSSLKDNIQERIKNSKSSSAMFSSKPTGKGFSKGVRSVASNNQSSSPFVQSFNSYNDSSKLTKNITGSFGNPMKGNRFVTGGKSPFVVERAAPKVRTKRKEIVIRL